MIDVDQLAHGVLDLTNYFEKQSEIADTPAAKQYALNIVKNLDTLAWALSSTMCVCGAPLTGDAELCSACAAIEELENL